MPRLRKPAFLSAVLAAALFSGCVEQEMTIESNPPGALVFLNDQELGRTPLTRDFKWHGDYDVQLRLEGYQTLKTHHKVKEPWWNDVPFDLLANLWPFALRDSQHMSFNLTPVDASQDQPQNLLARAEDMRGQLESSQYTRPATPRPAPATKATTKPTTLPSTRPTTPAK